MENSLSAGIWTFSSFLHLGTPIDVCIANGQWLRDGARGPGLPLEALRSLAVQGSINVRNWIMLAYMRLWPKRRWPGRGPEGLSAS